MVVYVKLSKLTWAMEEAHLGRWLKKEGDPVSIGDPLCEIETGCLTTFPVIKL